MELHLHTLVLVGEDLLPPCAPAVAALGVLTGEVVNPELIVPADLQLVGDLPRGHAVGDQSGRLEVFSGKLEAVIPQRVLARPQLLTLLPQENASRLASAAFQILENELLVHRKVRMPTVLDDHLVTVRGVLEEVVDTLLFHESAGEVEVGLPILDAIVARLVRPLKFPLDVEA